MTTVLTLHSDPSSASLDEAARVVRTGGILAVPTETFYGLAASITDERALRRVIAIKGRPDGKPILVLIADRAQLTGLAADPTPAAKVLMDRCWPGPVTLIMGASASLSPLLTGGTGTIGIRQPAHSALRKLLRHVGPLTGTSANRSGQPPACRAHDVLITFGSEVDLILDGGPTAGGEPSTIVNTVGTLRIVRQGAFSRRRIAACLAGSGFTLEE